jgi:hypothetical protein
VIVPVESVVRGAMVWKSVTVMFAAGLPLIRIVNRGGEDLEAISKMLPAASRRATAMIRERFIGRRDFLSG